MAATTTVERVTGAVRRAGDRARDVDDFLAGLSDVIGKAVPFDGAMFFGVDPATLLASAPARIENLDASLCWPFWHGEFHDHDVALFRDLARQPVPVSSLRLATGGAPLRSPRFRDFLRPQGYGDELRVVFRTGSTAWGVAALYRDRGRAAFEEAELDLLAGVSRAVGAELRARSVRHGPGAPPLVAPGVLLFDGESRLLSANQEAKAWLCQLFGPSGDDSWTELLRADMSLPLMQWPIMQPLVSRARAVASGYDEGPARLRIMDRGGRWVVLHASCLDDADAGSPVAVVVEPAKSAEIAPIVVEAYGLSVREQEVVQHVARGLSTPEIAAELFLSPHTVRDHIKSVFEKVGVGSRGELVAKLFAEHYEAPFHATMVHLH